MLEDARFEDGREKALRLKVLEVDDLSVVASLVQDAVFPASEMTWDRRARRFAVLLNRYRWEDKRAPERVQSVLVVEDAVRVASQGVSRGDADTVLSLLTLEWQAGEDGTGALVFTLAGDGAIRVEVEALEVTLTDVTRPYAAPSGKTPGHPEG